MVNSAVIPVGDIPGDQALFRAPVTLYFAAFPDCGVGATMVIMARNLVSNGAANRCASHCHCGPAVAVSDLVADDTTNDCADDGRGC